MNRNDEFYKAIGLILKALAKKRNLTIGSMRRRSGEQWNTVNQVLEGKPFYFHQASWIEDCFHISTSELISMATKQMAKGAFTNGEIKEEQEEKSNEEKGAGSFI